MNPLFEKATVFAENLDHPECVAVHPDGSVWAGGEAGQIYRISEDGNQTEELANTGGFILGIAFSPRAEWLTICDLGKKCLWKLDVETRELTLFSKGADGHEFSIPNYGVFDHLGNFYVTESGIPKGRTGKILKYSPDGKGEVWHAGPFDFANGMAMGIDEKCVYVVSSFMPGVERIEINENGSAGDRSVYCNLPETIPDGCALDVEGNLYVSCYTPNKIFKVQQDGTSSVLISDWEAHTLSNPTNIAFGGPDMTTMYSANLGRWHITKIESGIKGLPLVSHLK